MKDKLSFPSFTHDSIAGYCNDKPLWAQYRNDKKSKYIGTKQLWQELSKTNQALDAAVRALNNIATIREWAGLYSEQEIAQEAINQIKQITETKE